ncbi:uncharacterized protein LOC126749026 [Anthonomus grandis grandis]|uniref:uncharacterized protein LOC126749026 n=1 Tax=Anthonomus grandis grandis TaxID=2921223 RepID=UPI002165580E|nr:uncharacterized protein LOC126749026 [Anthonomus grandis grandis]
MAKNIRESRNRCFGVTNNKINWIKKNFIEGLKWIAAILFVMTIFYIMYLVLDMAFGPKDYKKNRKIAAIHHIDNRTNGTDAVIYYAANHTNGTGGPFFQPYTKML